MDCLQADIVSLEKENQELKKRLDAYSKKSLLTDIARHAQAQPGIAGLIGKQYSKQPHARTFVVQAYSAPSPKYLFGVNAINTTKHWKGESKIFLIFVLFLDLWSIKVRHLRYHNRVV